MPSNGSQTTLIDAWSEAWATPARTVPWQWAETNLDLSSRATPHPGRYSSEATPYVREPLESFQDPSVRTLTLCWSAQSGKTMTLLVALGYVIDEDPGPVLLVQSSLDAARSFSKNRLQPLIEDAPVLARHKTRDRFDFASAEMRLDNCSIYLQGAGSPSQLASRPIRYLLADEVDKWPDQSALEADALSLAKERVKTYRSHKVVLASTPTVDRGSIWQHYLMGDRREYHVPCPVCGAMFVLSWKLVKWNKTDTLEHIRAGNVWLECPHCQAEIQEKHKATMVRSGSWTVTNPDAPADHRSYHLNELYSPWTRWGELVVKFRQATAEAKKGDTGRLHNFVNSSLAEPWTEDQHRGESRPASLILARRTDRPTAMVPDDTLGLICGADTQDNGFWLAVWSFDRDLTMSLVTEAFVPDLATLTARTIGSRFTDTQGRAYGVNRIMIDAMGHRTAEIYDYARKNSAIHPVQGKDHLSGRTWTVSPVDAVKGRDGKRYPVPGGLNLTLLDTSFFKTILANKLMMDPGAPGGVRLPDDVSEDFVAHMGAEYQDDRGNWHCPKSKANHLWDCSIYALAGAEIAGIREWAEPLDLETYNQQRPAPRPKPSSTRRTSSWW